MITVDHTFRPGETIEAILKKINRHDVSKEELIDLLTSYRELNGVEVPRAGTAVKIPLLARHVNCQA